MSASSSGLFDSEVARRSKAGTAPSSKRPDRTVTRIGSAKPAAGPTDSECSRMRWESEGGACGPASDGPSYRLPVGVSIGRPPAVPGGDDELEWRRYLELIVLPFAEYSEVYPDRLSGLCDRLRSEALQPETRYIVLDATRVTRPGGILLGLLHAAAARLRREKRMLVLAGDLGGLTRITRLTELCPVTESRDAALRWCHERLSR